MAREMFYAGDSFKEITASTGLPLSTIYRFQKSWATQDIRVGISETEGVDLPLNSVVERRVLQNICRVLKLRPHYVNLPFDHLLSSLADSKVDVGMSSLAATVERRRLMDFTANYTNRLDPIHFYARRDARIFSVAQIYKGRFGVVRGTLHEPFLKKLGVTMRFFADVGKMSEALLAGKVDAILCNEANMSPRLQELLTTIPFESPIEYGEDGGFALAKRFCGAERVSDVLDKMVRVGMIDCLDEFYYGSSTPRESLLKDYEDLKRALEL